MYKISIIFFILFFFVLNLMLYQMDEAIFFLLKYIPIIYSELAEI